MMGKKVKKDNVSFNDFVSGEILTSNWLFKHIRYILFCAFLSLVYINSSYKTDNLLYEITNLQREINVLRNHSIVYNLKLQELAREQEVKKMLKEKDVKIGEEQKTIVEIISKTKS